jgi:molybdopterin-guanine dinucleotide biosynthesis protein B
VGASGSGKTTLLSRILPLLKEQGLRIGAIKHTHHDFNIDVPGKDSYELRKAGATQTLVGSRYRWALVVERQAQGCGLLSELIQQLQLDDLDIVLAEGFTDEPVWKIEVHRPALGKALRCGNDPYLIAVATDQAFPDAGPMTVMDLNDPDAIVRFIVKRFFVHSRKRPPNGDQVLANPQKPGEGHRSLLTTVPSFQ